METGIKNALGNAAITTNQKVYIRHKNLNQYTGTFDKTTTENNQTWLFNYNTTGEHLTNIPNLFNTTLTWENQTLINDTIVTQVQNFITATNN